MVADDDGRQVDRDEPRAIAELADKLLDLVPVAGQAAHPLPTGLVLLFANPDVAQPLSIIAWRSADRVRMRLSRPMAISPRAATTTITARSCPRRSGAGVGPRRRLAACWRSYSSASRTCSRVKSYCWATHSTGSPARTSSARTSVGVERATGSHLVTTQASCPSGYQSAAGFKDGHVTYTAGPLAQWTRSGGPAGSQSEPPSLTGRMRSEGRGHPAA